MKEEPVGSNQLTPEQVDQLVGAVAQCPLSSWTALRWGPKFNQEQQQKLVDGACKSPVHAASTLKDVPWLTEPQRVQLRVA